MHAVGIYSLHVIRFPVEFKNCACIGSIQNSRRLAERSGERHQREQLKVRIKESERAGKWEEAGDVLPMGAHGA